MKRLLLLSAVVAASMITVRFVANAQDDNVQLPVLPEPVSSNVSITGALQVGLNAGSATACLGGSVTSIPMDCYSFTSTKDGKAYTNLIVGRNPFLHGKTTTTINVEVIPLIVTIGASVFDPTAVNTCTTVHDTDVNLLQASPIFSSVTFDGAGGTGHGALMNGVSTGTGTYNDIVRRAEFWSSVGGSNYHTKYSVTVGSSVSVNSTSITGGGITNGSGCGLLGILYYNGFDSYIQGLIGTLGIPATTLPIFQLKNIVLSTSNPPTVANCCILGYHGVFGSIPGNVRVYTPLDFDSSGRFGGTADASIASHEMGELLDDPLGGNLGLNSTPAWGGIGQVSGCQSNWEVGDPLSGTLFPAITMSNGMTYHMQELAFFSWFFNNTSTSSLGTGGLFSSNGTFAGASKACPPGGTN